MSIIAENLVKYYSKRCVVNGVSLEVKREKLLDY